MKKVLCILAIVLVLSAIGIIVLVDYFDPVYLIDDWVIYVSDHGVLSPQEEDLLNEQIYEVVSKYRIYIQIKVIDSLGNISQEATVIIRYK